MTTTTSALELRNAVSGLMVPAKTCPICSGPFAPDYSDLGSTDQFCRPCINSGAVWDFKKGATR